MRHEFYLDCKKSLIRAAKEIKRKSNDKSLIRMVINDHEDYLNREIDSYAMRELYSQAAAEMYKNWIENLACKLHPKD